MLLGNLAHLIQRGHLVFPVYPVDKGIHKHIGTRTVIFHLRLLVTLVIIDCCLYQAFIELSVFQLFHLCQQNILGFFKRLSLFRTGIHHKEAVIRHSGRISIGRQQLLLLIDIQVYQSGFAVIQHLSHQFQQLGIFRSGPREPPCQRHIGSFQSQHLFHNRLFQRSFGFKLQLRQIFIRFHAAEIAVNRSNHLVRIEISRHADGHIVGHIPLFVIIFDIGDRGIFQMFLRSQHRLRSIRVIREQGGHNLLIHLAVILRQGHILLLIHRFQFGVETANHIMLETVGLYLGPVFHLIGRNILHIHRHIITGIGICTVCPDSRHQFVVLIRNG